jgi:7,8-dihydropterin-6-yl-methyl-4-(beta-D-ribofuranosyl)aminobenzene 5'-phosphate synthase
MSESIFITTLVENTVHQRRLKAEHGLAFHLQFGRRHVLFDTGQSDLLLHNARQLGLDLSSLVSVVLSHGHYDHCGGLEAVCALAPRATLHLHPAALEPKFARNPNGTSRVVGMAESARQTIRGRPDTVWTKTMTEVVPGLFATGEIPRNTPFEDTGGAFFLDEHCQQPDPIRDDQALFFDTPNGLVVILGCGHAGVVNTLEYIQHITNGRPIHTILGGMHLLTAGPDRMAKTIESFRHLKIQRIAPAHCTGISAVAQLWAAFPGRCSTCAVGVSMTFQNQ